MKSCFFIQPKAITIAAAPKVLPKSTPPPMAKKLPLPKGMLPLPKGMEKPADDIIDLDDEEEEIDDVEEEVSSTIQIILPIFFLTVFRIRNFPGTVFQIVDLVLMIK